MRVKDLFTNSVIHSSSHPFKEHRLARRGAGGQTGRVKDLFVAFHSPPPTVQLPPNINP